MELSPEKLADLHLKHLEMIQAIVTRMSNYGATLKNYCVTIIIAITGIALTQQHPRFVFFGFLPLIVFSVLDAQYLRLERRFRTLYDHTRRVDWTTMPDFEINLNNASPLSFWRVFFSWSIASFYLPVAICVAIVYFAGGLLAWIV